MHVGKLFRQFKTRRAQAPANKPLQYFRPLVARRLAILVIKVRQIDKPVPATLDQELFGVVAHRALAAHLAQLREHKFCKLVAAGRSKQKIKPAHALAPRSGTSIAVTSFLENPATDEHPQ